METNQKKKISDEECIAMWRALLQTFHELIKGNPKPEDIQDKLEELKKAARIAKELTPRQTEAIVARCNNYLSGEYGNTKKKENLEYNQPKP